MMYVKIHKSEGSEVVAVCDRNLIGEELDSGELHLKVSEGFYKGELKDRKEVKRMLKGARNINLVGRECIKIAEELGLVDEENTIMFNGVPYAQSLML